MGVRETNVHSRTNRPGKVNQPVQAPTNSMAVKILEKAESMNTEMEFTSTEGTLSH